jgi:hypothetical protein
LDLSGRALSKSSSEDFRFDVETFWLEGRVGKNPGFLKKIPAQWFFFGFFGFFGFFWVFFAQTRGFLGFFQFDEYF